MLDWAARMLEFLRMKATLFLMAVLVAPVMADDFDDYIATAYGGRGSFVRAGNTYIGSNDIITKAGNSYVSGRGIANRAGSTYITEDNKTVNRAGSAFISGDDIIIKAGNSYNGRNGTTISAGGFMSKP
jgi:hypothetical protein